MPVKYPSRQTTVPNPRRRRLALWLMMGCASPTLLGAQLPCIADEVDHARGLDGIGGVDIKVPAFRPTPTVHSVLGLLPGQYNNPVGTSIQLLPPAPAAAPAQVAVAPKSERTESDSAAMTNATSVAPPESSPKLVTRVNAKLGAPQLNWQARVPSFQPLGENVTGENISDHHVASRPASPTDEAHPKSQASPETTVPPHVEPNAVVAANRRGFPAWIEPAEQTGAGETTAAETSVAETVERSQNSWRPRDEARQPKPLRDPMPQLTSPQNDPAERDDISPQSTTVGSGLPKSSPVQAMPSSDGSPASTKPTEQLPSLDELPDPPDVDIAVRTLENKTNPHDGNNEGDATGRVEVDQWDGMTVHEMDDVDSLHPSLSTIDIEPLVIDPVESLQPAKDTADLRAVQENATASAPNISVPKDAAAKSSIGSVTQRDATGRMKTHAGMGAVADLDPAIARLQQPILKTLRSFHAQTEKADSRSNWGMMHAIMVFGTDTRIIARRRNYSAIAWMAGNNVCRGNRLMTTERGEIKVRQGTGLQGHQAQWLATLSLAGVPANYPLYANNQRFTIEDLVQVEAAACEEGTEITFTLIGLAHYLDTNATWAGVRGEPWDFERLIAAELDQPVVGAACGGTHRLMGFAHALRKRRLEGQPITGQWNRAEKFLDDFVEYSYTLQNRDGSFSTNWFESPQDNGDLSRKVQTTGHILEFLLTHLPDEELGNEHVVAAVRYLAGAMRRVEIDDAGVGYRAHVLRSLAMFHQRVYGTAPVYPPGQMAFGQHRNHHHR